MQKTPPRPNIDVLARACRVSPATVSRVFNRRGKVGPDTRQRVLAAAVRLGYSPQVTARRECLAIIVERYGQLSAGGYHGMLIGELSAHAARRGYRLEVVVPKDMPLLCDRFFHGAVSCLYEAEAALEVKRLAKIPLVTINHALPGIQAVVSDDHQGLSLAVGYLVARGHRRIGLLAKANDTFNGRERTVGYRRALSASGLKYDPRLVQTISSKISFVETLRHLVLAGPSAVIAPSEERGPILAHGLAMLGYRVPEDISVIAMEYRQVSEFLTPPQTTLAQDFACLAERALDLLEQPTGGKARARAGQPLTVPYRLVERASVTAPTASSPARAELP